MFWTDSAGIAASRVACAPARRASRDSVIAATRRRPMGTSRPGIDLTTFSPATSITETSFDTPFVDKRYFSSGVKASCQTRWPTSRYFVTFLVATSITATRLAGPSAAKAVLPSREIRIPTGWIASFGKPGMAKSIFCFTSCFTGSMTLIVPPTSDDTHSSDPSGVNCAKRGRASTRMLATICLRLRIDQMRHVGRLGRVDEDFAVRADRHSLRLDADRDFADDFCAS